MKNPKVSKQVRVEKKPKSAKDPELFKDAPISWQLNRIDDDSRWGISVFRNNIKIVKNNNLFDGIDDINDILANALIDLMGKNFDSVESFLENLCQKDNVNISATELSIILKSIDENIFWKDIYPTLKHFEKKTWFEIESETFYGKRKNKTKHHSVQISKLIPEARRRLETLRLDDIDELFSIRISGKIRLWGIRKKSYFQALWFDLKHEICPSKNN